jgi:hypothetical protein
MKCQFWNETEFPYFSSFFGDFKTNLTNLYFIKAHPHDAQMVVLIPFHVSDEGFKSHH